MRPLLLLAVFALVAAAPLISSYTASSAGGAARESAAPRAAAVEKARPAAVAPAAESVTATEAAAGALGFGGALAGANPLLAALLQSEDNSAIATYGTDGQGNCVITPSPQLIFNLGDEVCVRVTASHLDDNGNPHPEGVKWVARTGSVVQSDSITLPTQTFTFTLPQDETTQVVDTGGGIVEVDNRGLWRVYTTSAADSSVRRVAYFLVRAQTQYVDLSLSQSVPSSAAQVAPGANSFFEIFLTNNGPNDAANVVLTNATPAGAAFVGLDETTSFGFNCTPPGVSAATCTAASLPARATARFIFQYQVDGGATPGGAIENIASVTSTTAELEPADNASTLSARVLAAAGGETCSLTCHEDITVSADTVDENNVAGAFVDYGSAAQVVGNCGAVTSSHLSGSFFPVGENTVTISSENGGGSCTFTITVVGTPPPAISCPADVTVTVQTGETSATVNPGTPTTNPADGVTVVGVRSDSLPPDPEQPGQQVPVPLTDPYPVGTTAITWTVTDAIGLKSSCTQRINVRETARPALSISCPANIEATAPADSCEAAVSVGTPTTNLTDQHVSVEGVRSDGRPLSEAYPAGETRITWTATDAVSGNVASCIQTIRVSATHNTAPTLNVPPDVTVETTGCSAIVDDELGAATGAGSCGTGAVSITRTGVPRRFLFPTGTTIVTYTATDSAGNTTTGTQKVTVIERTAPTINAPADVEVTANDSCQATGVALGAATFGDNCAGSTVSNDAPAVFPVGETTVTWTVKDRSGNTATDTQIVRVVDRTAPNVSTPETIEASADASCQVAVPSVAVNATDNCTLAGDLTITQTPAAGTPVGLGDHTITVTVRDAAGNESSDTTVLRVSDTTAPAITVPANIVVSNDPDSCSAVVNFVVTAADNCDATPEVSTDIPSGATFQKGTTTVTATARDDAGNVSTRQFTVTVNDTQSPAITHPASVEVLLDPNTTDVSRVVEFEVTAADNCPGVQLSVSPASGSIFPVGPTVVTATATDSSGNTTTKQFTVTVLYRFTGFFNPIANLPTLNEVKAGQSVPVKFSLSGNKGLNIFAAGSPTSGVVPCDSNSEINPVEGTQTAGGSTLQYDAATDQYTYVWKTEKAWATTCRQFVVQLNDGSLHHANFKFK